VAISSPGARPAHPGATQTGQSHGKKKAGLGQGLGQGLLRSARNDCNPDFLRSYVCRDLLAKFGCYGIELVSISNRTGKVSHGN